MAEKNLGLILAVLVRRHAYPVPKVAAATGATRATVYNWLSGKGVSPAYQYAVGKLIAKLQSRKK